ncbi:hypothetical protein [Cupriavidus nantongensis]|uniref:Uncharacterized protein n=1 Tax=Cupriavidus nantongensis TaxID=1796606 RepID=A0A142JMH3_9BURK|nr:hypothetical protein [Cupriavidus nantongensis]AMR79285.1 hypothetical protein A2G96_16935 [Cupriavidus nantongensis]
MSFSLSTSIADVVRNQYSVYARQVPFAAALALTRTAQRAAEAEEQALQRSFESPTPFTLRAIGVQRATKQNLAAAVFVKDRQAAYLRPEIEGGRRELKTFEQMFQGGYVVPAAGVKRNQYGNVSKATIKRIAGELNTSGNAKRYFRGVPRGHNLPAGIYARVNNNTSIVPLMVFARDPIYEKRFQFSEVAELAARDGFEAEMAAAWAQALASAR